MMSLLAGLFGAGRVAGGVGAGPRRAVSYEKPSELLRLINCAFTSQPENTDLEWKLVAEEVQQGVKLEASYLEEFCGSRSSSMSMVEYPEVIVMIFVSAVSTTDVLHVQCRKPPYAVDLEMDEFPSYELLDRGNTSFIFRCKKTMIEIHLKFFRMGNSVGKVPILSKPVSSLAPLDVLTLNSIVSILNTLRVGALADDCSARVFKVEDSPDMLKILEHPDGAAFLSLLGFEDNVEGDSLVLRLPRFGGYLDREDALDWGSLPNRLLHVAKFRVLMGLLAFSADSLPPEFESLREEAQSLSGSPLLNIIGVVNERRCSGRVHQPEEHGAGGPEGTVVQSPVYDALGISASSSDEGVFLSCKFHLLAGTIPEATDHLYEVSRIRRNHSMLAVCQQGTLAEYQIPATLLEMTEADGGIPKLAESDSVCAVNTLLQLYYACPLFRKLLLTYLPRSLADREEGSRGTSSADEASHGIPLLVAHALQNAMLEMAFHAYSGSSTLVDTQHVVKTLTMADINVLAPLHDIHARILTLLRYAFAWSANPSQCSVPLLDGVFLVKIQQGLAPGASKDREGMGSNSAFDHHGDGALAAQGVHHSKGDCVEVLSSGGESLSSVQRVLDHRFRDGRTIQTLPKHLILHGSVKVDGPVFIVDKRITLLPYTENGRAKYESIMARVELLENSIPRLEAEFRGLEYVKSSDGREVKALDLLKDTIRDASREGGVPEALRSMREKMQAEREALVMILVEKKGALMRDKGELERLKGLPFSNFHGYALQALVTFSSAKNKYSLFWVDPSDGNWVEMQDSVVRKTTEQRVMLEARSNFSWMVYEQQEGLCSKGQAGEEEGFSDVGRTESEMEREALALSLAQQQESGEFSPL